MTWKTMQEHVSDCMPWCSQHTGRGPLCSCSHLDRTGQPYGVCSLAPMGDRLHDINTAEAQLQAIQYT